MFYNKYYRNSLNDINKLKEDLMSQLNKPESSITSARHAINEKEGKYFEENIRRILEFKYGFKKLEYPEKIFMKTIFVGGQKIEFLQGEKADIKVNNIKYIIEFDENLRVLIMSPDDKIKKEIKSKTENIENIKIEIEDNEFDLISYPHKEIEFDGYFQMDNFSVNKFDEKEIKILYSNINKDEEKKYSYSIVESKLGADKADEIINQIRKDHHLLKHQGRNDIIILGFVNSVNIKNANYFMTLKNKKCVIYGIKDSKFCGKEVSQPIDWDLEKRFNDLSEKIDIIYDYIMKNKEKENIQRRDDIRDKEEGNLKIAKKVRDEKGTIVKKEKKKGEERSVGKKKDEYIKEEESESEKEVMEKEKAERKKQKKEKKRQRLLNKKKKRQDFMEEDKGKDEE